MAKNGFKKKFINFEFLVMKNFDRISINLIFESVSRIFTDFD